MDADKLSARLESASFFLHSVATGVESTRTHVFWLAQRHAGLANGKQRAALLQHKANLDSAIQHLLEVQPQEEETVQTLIDLLERGLAGLNMIQAIQDDIAIPSINNQFLGLDVFTLCACYDSAVAARDSAAVTRQEADNDFPWPDESEILGTIEEHLEHVRRSVEQLLELAAPPPQPQGKDEDPAGGPHHDEENTENAAGRAAAYSSAPQPPAGWQQPVK